MYSMNSCAVCGNQGQVLVGPDEVYYCSACYRIAFPKVPKRHYGSVTRQQRIVKSSVSRKVRT